MTNNQTLEKKYLHKVVKFVSGNYRGLTGFCLNVDLNSLHTKAIYGITLTFVLSNGQIGYAHKSEHFEPYKGAVNPELLEVAKNTNKAEKALIELQNDDAWDEDEPLRQKMIHGYQKMIRKGITYITHYTQACQN